MELRYHLGSLEVRDDGRTIVGVAVPYGQPTDIGPYTETFIRGAFADVDPATVPLTATHPRSGDQLPIGVAVELRNEPDGLYGSFKVSDVDLGNDVLTLVRDKAVTGLSIGFVPVTDRWSRDRKSVERVRAILDHVAVVRSPAYPTARIATVRATQPPLTPLLHLARRRRP
jgi:HK97 family phage prohead protease